jgi:SAM-dependent methyltransferase
MEWTGERFLPELGGRIRYEHLHRYALARELARDRVVLDLACGEGYGAAMLASVAAQVVGVDQDARTIEHAEARYGGRANLTFRRGSCDVVPIADGSVDLVVSFETIEHHDRHEEMLREIKRVLRPAGALIISSPNRATYSDRSAYHNPFHVKELSLEELVALLRRHFACVRLYGQQLTAGSLVSSLDASPGEAIASYVGEGIGADSRVVRRPYRPPAPVYFVAVCGDTPAATLPALDSIFFDQGQSLFDAVADEHVLLRIDNERLVRRLRDTQDSAATLLWEMAVGVARRRLPPRLFGALRGTYRAGRATAGRVGMLAVDVRNRLGRRLVPPSRLHAAVGGGFETVGAEFFGYCVSLCGLEPHESVLDVGCGVGRLAVPLTRYLSREGRYEGFDVNLELVDWCRDHITPRFPQFHFQHADLANGTYNAGGRLLAAEYRFPYPDRTFDLTIANSVFTHILPADADHYLAEISRTLKRGGRCLITFFLLNAESRWGMRETATPFRFSHVYADGVCRVMVPDRPEAALAYEEDVVRALFARHGLTIVEPIRYGSWCRREEVLSLQDIVVARLDEDPP